MEKLTVIQFQIQIKNLINFFSFYHLGLLLAFAPITAMHLFFHNDAIGRWANA